MSFELQSLGNMIIQKKYEIAREVHNNRLAGIPMTQEQQRQLEQVEADLLNTRANFISLFGEALVNYMDKDGAVEKIEKWGRDTGNYFYSLGVTLDEALKDSSFYREYLWKAIQKEASANNLSVSTIFEAIFIIDPLLDKAVYYFSLSFVNSFQTSLENAKSTFLELSVPVVPLVPGVGVLPLIGNIDTERARLLMEETLKQAGKLKLSHLVLDLSGVLIVDTMVADQLFKVIDALSLIGVKTIITGIRPEVAQTMVSLGLKLDNITVKANLYQAFNEITLIKNL
ncbi:STAS domain-containing protein [Peribacillus sp. SCS-155]|uniref:STAS domain-containing protein n=1 Tax=Peribacillus sedimenti TaxID=3115297 RepID=UPI003905CA97